MRGGWEHEDRDDARDPDSTQPVNCNRKISTMPPGGDGNNRTLNDIKCKVGSDAEQKVKKY